MAVVNVVVEVQGGTLMQLFNGELLVEVVADQPDVLDGFGDDI